MTPISLNVLLRALAILAVVFNHSFVDRYFAMHGNVDNFFFGLGLDGGSNILMLISGYNFAEFILTRHSVAEMQSAILRFGARILIPSFLLVLFFFAFLGKFNLPELLFIRNFWTLERVAKFPTWYPQVLMQLLLVLYIVLPLFNRFKNARPAMFAVASLGVAVALCLAVPAVFPLTSQQLHWPSYYLWTFTLGWVIYFLTTSSPVSRAPLHGKWAATALVVAAAFLCLTSAKMPAYALIAGGLALIWVQSVMIPTFLRHPLYLVSQATFTIFLFHRFFFEVLLKVMPNSYTSLLLFAVGLGGSLMLWVASTAFVRGYRQARQQKLGY